MYGFAEKKKKETGKTIQRKSIRAYPGVLRNLDEAHSVNLVSLQPYGGMNRPEILRLTIPQQFVLGAKSRANLISQHVSPKAAQIGSNVSAALAMNPGGWNDWGAPDNPDTLDEFNVVFSVPGLDIYAEQEFNRLANGYMRHTVITNTAAVDEYTSNGAHALDEQQALFESYNGMAAGVQGFVRNVANQQINFGVQTNVLSAAQIAVLRTAVRTVLYQEALAVLVNGVLAGVQQQYFSEQLRERAGGAAGKTAILNKLNQHQPLLAEELHILKVLLPLCGQVLPQVNLISNAHAAPGAMSTLPLAATPRIGFIDQHQNLAGVSVNDAINMANSGHAADALSMATVEAARFEFLRGRIGRMRTSTWLIFHQRAIKMGEMFTNYSAIVASTGVNINQRGWERYGLTAAQVSAWAAGQALGAAPAAGLANGVQNRNWAETTGNFYIIL